MTFAEAMKIALDEAKQTYAERTRYDAEFWAESDRRTRHPQGSHVLWENMGLSIVYKRLAASTTEQSVIDSSCSLSAYSDVAPMLIPWCTVDMVCLSEARWTLYRAKEILLNEEKRSDVENGRAASHPGSEGCVPQPVG